MIRNPLRRWGTKMVPLAVPNYRQANSALKGTLWYLFSEHKSTVPWTETISNGFKFLRVCDKLHTELSCTVEFPLVDTPPQ